MTRRLITVVANYRSAIAHWRCQKLFRLTVALHLQIYQELQAESKMSARTIQPSNEAGLYQNVSSVNDFAVYKSTVSQIYTIVVPILIILGFIGISMFVVILASIRHVRHKDAVGECESINTSMNESIIQSSVNQSTTCSNNHLLPGCLWSPRPSMRMFKPVHLIIPILRPGYQCNWIWLMLCTSGGGAEAWLWVIDGLMHWSIEWLLYL